MASRVLAHGARATPRERDRTDRGRSALRAYGPFAMALYLLAFSKWGSYVLPGPPYVADLVVGLVLLERAYAGAQRRSALEAVDTGLMLVGGCLLIWTLARLAFSPLTMFRVDTLRDAAPYLYAVLLFMVPAPRMSSDVRKRMEMAVTVALVAHSVWLTIDQLDPTLPLRLPLLGHNIFVFETRTDFDSLVCGLIMVLSVHRLILGRSIGPNLLLAALNAFLVLSLSSRAGLLATIVMLLALIALSPTRRQLARRYAPRVLAVTILTLAPVIVAGASQSLSVQRLISGLSVYLPFASSGTGVEVAGAAGTTRARRDSWHVLEVYLAKNGARNYLGVGFGPNVLHDSGADQVLLGGDNSEVRSPHNYFLNTWARLGILGLVLVIGLLLAGLRLCVRLSRREAPLSDVDLVALLLVAGLPVAAAVGVILESPFGALPYFWALGHLSSRSVAAGATASYRPFTSRRLPVPEPVAAA